MGSLVEHMCQHGHVWGCIDTYIFGFHGACVCIGAYIEPLHCLSQALVIIILSHTAVILSQAIVIIMSPVAVVIMSFCHIDNGNHHVTSRCGQHVIQSHRLTAVLAQGVFVEPQHLLGMAEEEEEAAAVAAAPGRNVRRAAVTKLATLFMTRAGLAPHVRPIHRPTVSKLARALLDLGAGADRLTEERCQALWALPEATRWQRLRELFMEDVPIIPPADEQAEEAQAAADEGEGDAPMEPPDAAAMEADDDEESVPPEALPRWRLQQRAAQMFTAEHKEDLQVVSQWSSKGHRA